MISWQKLKSRYERFKRWQLKPVEYHMSEQEHECVNCGQHYTGNFCPCCSQKADMGRINWLSVHRGVMDIWGLGTRSLLYSVWQLLWRPGYFISDYISGKRQVSFPPVKMLFILAVIYSFIFYWLLPDIFNIQVDAIDEKTKSLFPFMIWYREHFSWATLLSSMTFILPTWILFRYAPRYPFHTIPEGFFIQILMAVLLMVLDTFSKLVSGLNDHISTPLSIVLYALYYIVAYKQLFGYSLWGTIWRQLFMWFSYSLLLSGGLFLTKGIIIGNTNGSIEKQMGYQAGVGIFMLLLAGVILLVGYLVNRFVSRKRIA